MLQLLSGFPLPQELVRFLNWEFQHNTLIDIGAIDQNNEIVRLALQQTPKLRMFRLNDEKICLPTFNLAK